jgi:hypothetical protein
VESVVANPSVMKHHINGFTKLGEVERKFIAQVSLASYPSDTLLSELLEDDRVCRRAAELQECMAEEMSYLAELPLQVYALIGGTCGMSSYELKGCCLRAGHVSCAFALYRIFQETKRGIWGVAHDQQAHR